MLNYKIKYFLFFLIGSLCINTVYAQSTHTRLRTINEDLLEKLEALLITNGSFKNAVFLSEQAYQDKVSAHNYYYDFIKRYTKLAKSYFATSSTQNYKQSDSSNYLLNLALFNIFSAPALRQTSSLYPDSIPFRYNFDDPQGDKDFSSTFVTYLLASHTGNCRSMTYLYKILADELGAKCWLSLAPNHIYIRNYSRKVGWYNTELTSGTFPTDAWIAASGYVSSDAIRNGVYMDTLSNQQAIGLCILDLAHGYIKQTNNYTDGFVMKCCDLVLQYHSVNPMALLLKAEALKQLYLKQKGEKSAFANDTQSRMESIYVQLVKLGYREMPEKMYLKWITDLTKEKAKNDQNRPGLQSVSDKDSPIRPF